MPFDPRSQAASALATPQATSGTAFPAPEGPSVIDEIMAFIESKGMQVGDFIDAVGSVPGQVAGALRGPLQAGTVAPAQGALSELEQVGESPEDVFGPDIQGPGGPLEARRKAAEELSKKKPTKSEKAKE